MNPQPQSPRNSDAQHYLLVVKGKPEGPYSIAELRALKIKPGDFVKSAGMDDYKEAHEIAELCELFGFKQQTALPQYFAAFDQRLMAAALDWFLCGGACLVPVSIAAIIISDKATTIILAISLLVLIPVVNVVYHLIMEPSVKQGTFGKQLLNIRVTDLEGKRITVLHALLRNFCRVFSALPLFIGYLLPFFTKRQQCLHDMIANTLVIKDRLM